MPPRRIAAGEEEESSGAAEMADSPGSGVSGSGGDTRIAWNARESWPCPLAAAAEGPAGGSEAEAARALCAMGGVPLPLPGPSTRRMGLCSLHVRGVPRQRMRGAANPDTKPGEVVCLPHDLPELLEVGDAVKRHILDEGGRELGIGRLSAADNTSRCGLRERPDQQGPTIEKNVKGLRRRQPSYLADLVVCPQAPGLSAAPPLRGLHRLDPAHNKHRGVQRVIVLEPVRKRVGGAGPRGGRPGHLEPRGDPSPRQELLGRVPTGSGRRGSVDLMQRSIAAQWGGGGTLAEA